MFRTVAKQFVFQVCSLQTAAHSRHLNRKIVPMSTAFVTNLNFVRTKHVTSGIQGNRNSKQKSLAKRKIDSDEDEEETDTPHALAQNDLNLLDR